MIKSQKTTTMNNSNDKNDFALIGLDIGTSAIKGIAISTTGEILAEHSIQTTVQEISPGMLEFDANDQLNQVYELLNFLNNKIQEAYKIKAISIVAASGNTLLVDEANQPLSKVISWMDRRTTIANNSYLTELHKENIHQIVGWPTLESFPLAHLSWFKQEQTDVFQQAHHYCMNTDYIFYNLTGHWAMDHSTATTYYLQNQETRNWHKSFLEVLELCPSKLSELSQSGTLVSSLQTQASQQTGLDADTKVVLGSFDHPGAARGTGILEEGECLLSCGTSWVLFLPLYDRAWAISQNMLVDPFLQPSGPWAGMLSIPQIGRKMDWWINTIVAPKKNSAKERYALFDDLASQNQDEAIYIDLEKNINEETQIDANELKDKHSLPTLCYSLMASAANLVANKLKPLEQHGIMPKKITMVGGPTKSPIWPQIVANTLNKEITLVNGQCAGAYGAAILAGIGAGIYQNETHAWEAITVKKKTISPKEK